MDEQRERVVAGVDLGSNSFHMVVARLEADGRIHVLDRLRESVRLASGLDAHRKLSGKVVERALATLRRFRERLGSLPHDAVWAVGTNTLRQAKDGSEFLEKAEAALGHPIEIISGHEEARLIYLGVAQSIADDVGRHLVVDVGGGSSEFVIGERFETIALDSLYMGCVGFTDKYFGDGALSRDNFRRAEIAAALELASLREQYRRIGWQRATGSSGTALAIAEIVRANKWGDAITLDALKQIKTALLEQGNISRIALKGLDPDRVPVFAGGLAIMKATFESLGIERMHVSSGALREGIVYELLGRVTHEDVKQRTIRTFAERYKVDAAHATRVADTALALFEQVRTALEFDPEFDPWLLQSAATLHEIGLSIAYAGYHKHSAYILEHADMPGFSRDEQQLLAAVVRAHRRRFSRDLFNRLTKEHKRSGVNLAILLRLAVRLHHSRSAEPLPKPTLLTERGSFRLTFPPGWLDERPLTSADLEDEAAMLQAAGVTLSFR
ncbi:MAG TPA: Ppx/GppA phosphatase family protein [Polyangiaceae bacterium]|nr:Ppx/GppA phosphatase family protein [Polyangiaceae bacterium]